MIKLPEIKQSELFAEMQRRKKVLLVAEFRSCEARAGGARQDDETGKKKTWNPFINHNVEVFGKAYALPEDCSREGSRLKLVTQADVDAFNLRQQTEPDIVKGTMIVIEANSFGYNSEKGKEYLFGKIAAFLK